MRFVATLFAAGELTMDDPERRGLDTGDATPAANPIFEALTPREKAVLVLIVGGATSREAGTSLGISPRTVEFHRANIMQKSSARNVADLMRLVLKY